MLTPSEADVIVELLDKNFPKGIAKERGRAIVLVVEILMFLNKTVSAEDLIENIDDQEVKS